MIKIILIPSYEPDINLVNLVKKIDLKEYDIVIVNDGSNNNYNKYYNACIKYAKVIGYKNNKGKGYAIKTGLNYIKNKYINNYIVVTMDSDGQHDINDAYKLCNYVINNPYTYTLGKRLRGDNTPLRSKIGNRITKVVYSMCCNIEIYDTQTGLRAFSDKLVDFMLSIEGNRFEYEMNCLLMASRNNINIKEIEIKTIYIDNNSHTHFNTIKDSYLIYKNIIKYSLSSLLCFLIDYVLFIIFNLIFNITLSNIFARFISATVNYTVNRNLVFKSNKKIYKSFISYFVLVVLILILNTILLNIFINFSINKFIAKVIVELVLFIISYIVQNKIIFRKEI